MDKPYIEVCKVDGQTVRVYIDHISAIEHDGPDVNIHTARCIIKTCGTVDSVAQQVERAAYALDPEPPVDPFADLMRHGVFTLGLKFAQELVSTSRGLRWLLQVSPRTGRLFVEWAMDNPTYIHVDNDDDALIAAFEHWRTIAPGNTGRREALDTIVAMLLESA